MLERKSHWIEALSTGDERNPMVTDAGRRQRTTTALCAGAICILLTSGCFGPTDDAAPSGGGEDAALDVFVSVLPQSYLVERLAGPHARVHVLVQPGQSPATYAPDMKQIAALAEADLFFRVGVPFEAALIPKIQEVMTGTLVDTREGVPLRCLGEHHHHGNPAEDHAHGPEGTDPHIWLAPACLKIQARTMRDALAAADPDHADVYTLNCDRLVEELNDLDHFLSLRLDRFKGRRLYVFHPSYGYFTDAYGLEQVAVEMEGKSPTPRQLQTLIERARKDGVTVIFVQPQFDTRSAEHIAKSIDGTVSVLDPLAKDIPANLRKMAKAIEGTLGSLGTGDE
ncbi:MAG: zinc ABC transporter solute-binding protein [bacterium]|nr:zinc ABC transporter solute-binding protein [bacterium]